jgi:hypothetical protein
VALKSLRIEQEQTSLSHEALLQTLKAWQDDKTA